jgi:hypothetical protein
MTTAAFPNLISSIVSTFQSATQIQSLGITVYDGPTIDESWPQNWVSIGHDGTDEGDVNVGQARNTWELVGNYKMFEDGVINCSLAFGNGDTTISTVRAGAANMLSAVDTVIRLDPSFGGACLYSGLESHSYKYLQTTAGAGVQIDFTIAYKART